MSLTVSGKRLLGTAILATILMMGASLCPAADEEITATRLPTADTGIQAILHAMTQAQAAESSELFSQLKHAAKGRHPELVQQLFIFSLEAKGMREAMLPGVIIEVLEVTRADLAAGLLPLLDVDDERVRGKVKNWLGQVERPADAKALDFSVYTSLMKARGAEVPTALVRHMWERDPVAARAALVQAYGEEKAANLARDLPLKTAP